MKQGWFKQIRAKLLLTTSICVALLTGQSAMAQSVTTTTVTTHSFDFPGSEARETVNISVSSNCPTGDGDGDGDYGDPLVLDLNGDGVIDFLDEAFGVLFDMTGDGRLEATTWVGPDDGFVVMDRNKDGAINDHSEMFGTNGMRGFEHLGLYDSNHDGKIDADDDVWEELLVWRDENSDGVSQEHELKSLEAYNIQSIGLDYEKTAYWTKGSQVISEGSFETTDGVIRKAVDAAFTFFTNISQDIGRAISGRS